MKTLIAAAALSLVAGAAFAGEGNGDPFPFTAAGQVMTLNNYKQAAGANQNPYPFTMPGTRMVVGQVLPSNGSAGAVQTANSLPAGFSDGVPGQANVNPMTRVPTQLAQPTVPMPQTGG